jgi:Domain of unknown function (DUF4434)
VLNASRVLDSDRFAGWFVSVEIDNYRPTAPLSTALGGNLMLMKITSGLKKIAPKPVAISGYFRVRDYNMNESDFFDFLGTTLAGSGIDVFLFQDGVGVEDSIQYPEARLTPLEIFTLARRHAGVIKTCSNARVAAWADVELFVGQDGSQAAAPVRVLDQLAAAGAYRKRVVYDVDTDLTPLGDKRGATTLFDGIHEWLVMRPYRP